MRLRNLLGLLALGLFGLGAVAHADTGLTVAVEGTATKNTPAVSTLTVAALPGLTPMQGTVAVTFKYMPSRREKGTLEEVTLAGEFNSWDAYATPLKKNAEGDFEVTLNLAPGTYQWKFLLDGNWVQNMETIAERIAPKPDRYINDPYGGKNCQNDFK